jgi:hypothetical protein
MSFGKSKRSFQKLAITIPASYAEDSKGKGGNNKNKQCINAFESVKENKT